MTQVQKFNGNNPHNNQVVVDYDKRTVRFKPVKGKLNPYFEFLLGLILKPLIRVLGFVLILIVILTLMPLDQNVVVELWIQMTGLSTLICIVVSVLASLKYFDKKWRKEKYPEFNYKMMNSIFTKATKSIVTHNNVEDKMMIIPSFGNVMLSYKCYGDFNKYLKRIVIKNHFKKKAYNWYCIFKFSQHPKKGFMEISYL